METPETQTPIAGSYSANAARTHARSIDEMRRKIIKAYDLTPLQQTISPLTRSRLEAGFDDELRSNRWSDRRDAALKAEANPEQTAALNAAAKNAMLRYAEALQLREQVIDVLKHNHTPTDTHRSFYRNRERGTELMETYLGHIMNDTQACLEKFSQGDAVAALKMHGYLIERTMVHCKARGIKAMELHPKPEENQQPEDHLAMMQQYCDENASALRTHFKAANSDNKLSHAARASHSKNDSPSSYRY